MVMGEETRKSKVMGMKQESPKSEQRNRKVPSQGEETGKSHVRAKEQESPESSRNRGQKQNPVGEDCQPYLIPKLAADLPGYLDA